MRQEKSSASARRVTANSRKRVQLVRADKVRSSGPSVPRLLEIDLSQYKRETSDADKGAKNCGLDPDSTFQSAAPRVLDLLRWQN